MKIKINIDNKEYEVDKDTNLLEACLSLKLDLPYFCWHPELGSVAACRQCAIKKYKDEDDTKGKLVMACMEPVKENMRISLEDSEAHDFRAQIIELLMTNHPHDCPVCDEGGECHLQDMTVMTGHSYRRFRFKKRTHYNQYLGPFINHEMNRCIQCYRCVRFYNDYAGGKDFDVFAAHNDVYFGRYEPGVLESEFSGNLVEVCPTGVFTDKTLEKHYTRKWDFTNAPSICHNCSLGCNIIAGERYGTLRRIRSRYNSEVNGYFICDRGRFGYEYVNSEARIYLPVKRVNGSATAMTRKEAVHDIREITDRNKKMIGIGSPRASLESNFMLRQWVGAENFYAGISGAEAELIWLIKNILEKGTVKSPSLGEVKEYDAVFILGEDVTNTAPMLALHLRQSVRNKPMEQARELDIPVWNDAATRVIVQDEKGPVYIATGHATKLDEIATRSFYAHPGEIARLGYEVKDEVEVEVEEEITKGLASEIADALLNAKKPLIVAGTSLFSKAIVKSAASLAFALREQGKDPGLFYVVPEVNSLGLAIITDKTLEDALDGQTTDGVIILENDLYRRMDHNRIDGFLQKQNNIIALDYLQNATTNRATYVLPAGTFAESDGTVVNNEGRAQRFYQVYHPESDVRSSWEWIIEVLQDQPVPGNFHEILQAITNEFPGLEAVTKLAPSPDFRIGTQKVPREPHRNSGRTAIHAHVDVSEPKPPDDPDSALSFTMEGYTGVPPSAITPFYWTPGWNSVQAINKYQIEVGGPLHGGNPGKRVIEPSDGSGLDLSENIPPVFTPSINKYYGLPLYHIFGSEELSAQSSAIMERIPEVYIAMNDDDARQRGIMEEDKIEVFIDDKKYQLPVKLNLKIPKGVIGLPKGLMETSGITFPFEATINSGGHE